MGCHHLSSSVAFMPAFPRQGLCDIFFDLRPLTNHPHSTVDVHFFDEEEVREKGGLCLIAFQMILLATSSSVSSRKNNMHVLYISAIGSSTFFTGSHRHY